MAGQKARRTLTISYITHRPGQYFKIVYHSMTTGVKENVNRTPGLKKESAENASENAENVGLSTKQDILHR